MKPSVLSRIAPFEIHNYKVCGITAEQLLRSVTGQTVEGFYISEPPSVLNNQAVKLKIRWCLRESPDSLGRARICGKDQSPDAIDVDVISANELRADAIEMATRKDSLSVAGLEALVAALPEIKWS